MYREMLLAQQRSNLANEMMMFHMKVTDDEVSTLLKVEIQKPEKIHPDFNRFNFVPRRISGVYDSLRVKHFF